jgi:hypothetical protein
VHDHERVVAVDLGDAVADEPGQVEAAAFPVTGQVMAAALDGATSTRPVPLGPRWSGHCARWAVLKPPTRASVGLALPR